MRRTALIGWLMVFAATAEETPHRIVSLSPNMTEVLYGIGAFDQVAGVSDFCTYPPEVVKLPSVGGWQHPNLERLTALRPDLVVLDEGQAPSLESEFQHLGFRVLVVSDHTVADVYAAMATLGRVTGHEAQAAQLAAATRAELLRVSQGTALLSKPSVVLIVDRTPGTLRNLDAAAAGSFLAELVAIAGGRIVAPRFPRGYGKLNKEDLLKLDPDVILDFIHGIKGRLAGDPLEAWREIPELKAVRAQRVEGVMEDYVPHATQRMAETAELFARLIHPEMR
jgi:iron complex transport system substrate-binding protein